MALTLFDMITGLRPFDVYAPYSTFERIFNDITGVRPINLTQGPRPGQYVPKPLNRPQGRTLKKDEPKKKQPSKCKIKKMTRARAFKAIMHGALRVSMPEHKRYEFEGKKREDKKGSLSVLSDGQTFVEMG